MFSPCSYRLKFVLPELEALQRGLVGALTRNNVYVTPNIVVSTCMGMSHLEYSGSGCGNVWVGPLARYCMGT